MDSAPTILGRVISKQREPRNSPKWRESVDEVVGSHLEPTAPPVSRSDGLGFLEECKGDAMEPLNGTGPIFELEERGVDGGLPPTLPMNDLATGLISPLSITRLAFQTETIR